MSDQESLEEMYEENMRVSKEEKIREEFDRIQTVFKDEDGRIIPQDSNQAVVRQVLSVVIGTAVAYNANSRDSDSVPNEELYSVISAEKNTIRSGISDLLKKGFIEKVDSAEHRLVYSKLSDALDYINND